jgi:hypothetical protein
MRIGELPELAHPHGMESLRKPASDAKREAGRTAAARMHKTSDRVRSLCL